MNPRMEMRKRETRLLGLLGDAVRALTRTTGLKATVNTRREPVRAKGGARVDATVRIEANGKRFRFFAEIKPVDRAVALATAKNQLRKHGRYGLLVAPYLTAELADQCRKDLDLQFIDTAGNAYLRAPGLYVFVRGGRPPTTATAMGTRVRVILVIDGKVIMNSDGVGVRATARIVDGAWGDSNGERFPFPFPNVCYSGCGVGKRGPSHGGAETKLKAIAIPGEWGSALVAEALDLFTDGARAWQVVWC